jgi:Rrf2 family transcriptional regulator, iron-sulfur cluster assembly transcription factor
MKLTSKSRYAVTAMLDVAFNSQLEPVSLADIAQRQHISLAYLEQLFMKLRQQLLVKSIRGPGGGYLLNRALDEISIGHIIDAVGDEVEVTKCQGQANCQQGQQCLTHSLWCELTDQLRQYLYGMNLAELMRKQSILSVIERQSQHPK